MAFLPNWPIEIWYGVRCSRSGTERAVLAHDQEDSILAARDRRRIDARGRRCSSSIALKRLPLESGTAYGAERYLLDGVPLPPEILDQMRQEARGVLGALATRASKQRLPGHLFRYSLAATLCEYPPAARSDRLVPIKQAAADVSRGLPEKRSLYADWRYRRKGTPASGIDEDINTRHGVERIIVAAFEYAKATKRTRLHMADKSNALRHAHELWLRVFNEVRARYPGIEGVHMYVDALCLRLVQAPEEFQVIVTNNLFGDIVTDLAAALQGGLGMAASANVHSSEPSRVAMFEPVHGSAPSIAGKDLANPVAALATVGMMLAHSAGRRRRRSRAPSAGPSNGNCRVTWGAARDPSRRRVGAHEGNGCSKRG